MKSLFFSNKSLTDDYLNLGVSDKSGHKTWGNNKEEKKEDPPKKKKKAKKTKPSMVASIRCIPSNRG